MYYEPTMTPPPPKIIIPTADLEPFSTLTPLITTLLPFYNLHYRPPLPFS